MPKFAWLAIGIAGVAAVGVEIILIDVFRVSVGSGWIGLTAFVSGALATGAWFLTAERLRSRRRPLAPISSADPTRQDGAAGD
jgi:hypothetical protein